MAIFPTDNAPEQPIDIQAWTEEATVAISSMTISQPGEVPGTSVSLHIPLDTHPAPHASLATTPARQSTPLKRKEPLRRDSLKRREALLRGKEGSRRRQRWENDRLLTNPHAEPPSPADWEIRPTHRVQHVPYYLAPLWDAGLKRQAVDRKAASAHAKSGARTVAKNPVDAGVVPKELRDKMKKARGAKGLLYDLEVEVREFVRRVDEQCVGAWDEEDTAGEEEEDEEIVFVGRDGRMRDMDVEKEMMVFETEEGDQSGRFARWLVHHIGTYYGLRTWSVTRGVPAMREAYIGVRERERGKGRERRCTLPLPLPLWGLV
ncbi:hypothetical protein M011DRAFT_495153 [Sporormia fimetaria CBS 119925]|uniref:R3H-associated N-terminal domain-containing protein n=1 Tax=Sporormia fimetaria CBS 119925 TaxID=1340428 RepID=A0A6A6V9I2_9PLEO|nr:hypothetical protein M011DRAFT_495153 [Sporormia fimetaria CBS 119925]